MELSAKDFTGELGLCQAGGQGGVIFSDGVAADFLRFNAGMIAAITLAEKFTRWVMMAEWGQAGDGD